MNSYKNTARSHLSSALALSDSLIRYAKEPTTQPDAARVILDRAPLLTIHLIDATRAVNKIKENHE